MGPTTGKLICWAGMDFVLFIASSQARRRSLPCSHGNAAACRIPRRLQKASLRVATATLRRLSFLRRSRGCTSARTTPVCSRGCRAEGSGFRSRRSRWQRGRGARSTCLLQTQMWTQAAPTTDPYNDGALGLLILHCVRRGTNWVEMVFMLSWG
jgi:hypothetical protein